MLIHQLVLRQQTRGQQVEPQEQGAHHRRQTRAEI